MGITLKESPEVTDKLIEKMYASTLLKLRYIGERCIIDARLKGSYTDRTGNLRSSVGYVIIDHGAVAYMSNFGVKKDGADGSKVGKDYALSLVPKFPTGLALIVVAGMNYAAYVQRRGYNVLASAELLAEKLVVSLGVGTRIIHNI